MVGYAKYCYGSLDSVATTDPGLILVSLLPGNSRWQSNFDFNTYGVQGAQNQIYRGRIRFEKRFLWIGPKIMYNITNQSYNAPATALPFDTYSGGRLDLNDFVGDIPILGDLVNVVNNFYGFIPVVSSLDIKRNNGVVNPIDYSKKYAGGVTPEPALTSGFQNFIVDYNNGNNVNNEHISFQVRNGDWLAQELSVDTTNPVYPSVDCRNFCSDVEIEGNSSFCKSATYSAPSVGNTYNWTITQGANLVTLVGNGTQIITLTAINGASGRVTIRLTMGDNLSRCGSVTIT